MHFVKFFAARMIIKIVLTGPLQWWHEDSLFSHYDVIVERQGEAASMNCSLLESILISISLANIIYL